MFLYPHLPSVVICNMKSGMLDVGQQTSQGMGFHKSTLVARGANTQLDPSCVSAPPATNVDLFACFAERLFKSSSINYLPCRRVGSDSLYVGMPYAWSIDRTASRMFNRQNSQDYAIFKVVITGELSNSLWHLYQKCLVI